MAASPLTDPPDEPQRCVRHHQPVDDCVPVMQCRDHCRDITACPDTCTEKVLYVVARELTADKDNAKFLRAVAFFRVSADVPVGTTATPHNLFALWESM